MKMPPTNDGIVVTGFSGLTPNGAIVQGQATPVGFESFQERTYAGKSGIGPPELIAPNVPIVEEEVPGPDGAKEKISRPVINAIGMIPVPNLRDWIKANLKGVIQSPKELKYLGPVSTMGLIVAAWALQSSRLLAGKILCPGQEHRRLSVHVAANQSACPFAESQAIGQGLAPSHGLWEFMLACKRLDPCSSMRFMASSTAAACCRQLGEQSWLAATTHTEACASFGYALREAYHHLLLGLSDIAVVVGSDSPCEPYGLASFLNTSVISTRKCRPEEASAPGDLCRDGFVLAEGAGAVVLERREDAEARGADIWALLAGFGSSIGKYNPGCNSPEGVATAITRCLEDAGLSFRDIALISAHLTSTPSGDPIEVAGIKMAGGSSYMHPLVVNSKSALGHFIVAAGVPTLLYVLLAMINDLVPPNLNQRSVDPACKLNYVGPEPLEARINAALCNFLGFGCQHIVGAFKRP